MLNIAAGIGCFYMSCHKYTETYVQETIQEVRKLCSMIFVYM